LSAREAVRSQARDPESDAGAYASASHVIVEANVHDGGTPSRRAGRMFDIGFLRDLPIQMKLETGQPGDSHEVEADAVSEVLTTRPRSLANSGSKKDLAGTMNKSEVFGSENPLARLGASRPLDQLTLDLMESNLGYDFGAVRVHSDAESAASAAALHARAYAVGNHIVFAADQYRPSTQQGQRLLAHELTHTIQQGFSQRLPSGPTGPSAVGHVQRSGNVKGTAEVHTGLPVSIARQALAPSKDSQQEAMEAAQSAALGEPAFGIRPDDPVWGKLAVLWMKVLLQVLESLGPQRIEALSRHVDQAGGGFAGRLRLAIDAVKMKLNSTKISEIEEGFVRRLDILPLDQRKEISEYIVGRLPEPGKIEVISPAPKAQTSEALFHVKEIATQQAYQAANKAAPPPLTVEQRVSKLRTLINAFWTGNAEEEQIIAIIESTPDSQAPELVRALKERKINGQPFLDELDRVVDFGNNLTLHSALSKLRLKAMGPEEGIKQLKSAPILPWHDVMGFFETPAVFGFSQTADGKVRIEYPELAKDFGREMSRLPIDIFLGGVTYEPNQVLVIHDYDSGKFVPIVAQELIGFQHAGVRGFLSHVGTVASFAMPVGAAESAIGKAAVFTLERALPAAFLLIDENRLNLVEWFPKWGPKMLYYSDLVQAGVGLYGIARFAVSGAKIFSEWKALRNARNAMEGASVSAKAETTAAQIERESDKIFAEVEKIQASHGPQPVAAEEKALAKVSETGLREAEKGGGTLSGARKKAPAMRKAKPVTPAPEAEPRLGVPASPENPMILIESPDLLAKYAPNITREAGFRDVVVHGTPGSLDVLHNGKWVKLRPNEFRNWLRSQGFRGKEDIRLISCSTGANPKGVAQDIANGLGVRVKAPTDKAWVFPDGHMTVGPTQKGGGSWEIFTPGPKKVPPPSEIVKPLEKASTESAASLTKAEGTSTRAALPEMTTDEAESAGPVILGEKKPPVPSTPRITSPPEYEEHLAPILKTRGYLSKDQLKTRGTRFRNVPGIDLPPSEQGKLIAGTLMATRGELFPDFVNPKTGAIADAKWYYTLKTKFGQYLSDKSWYSVAENRLKVQSMLTQQILNYAEVQKQIQGQASKFGVLARVPDPPILLIFPENQNIWLTFFLDRFPGVRWEIIP
jgi:hypothetical protein